MSAQPGLIVRGEVRRRSASGSTPAGVIPPVPGSKEKWLAVAPLLTAAALTSGFLVEGFNSHFGLALSYLVMTGLTLALLFILPQRQGFWDQAARPFLWVGAAFIWLMAAHFGVAKLLTGLPPFAPDLFTGRMLGFVAVALAMLAGMMIGARPRLYRQVLGWIRHGASASLLYGLLLASQQGSTVLTEIPLNWHGRFAGLIGNANVTGVLAGVVALLALDPLLRQSQERRRAPLTLALAAGEILLSLWVLMATASRTGLIVTVLLIMATVLVTRGIRIWRTILALAIMALGLWLAYRFAGGELVASRLSSLGEEVEARTRLWTFCMELVGQSPLVGYGPGGFSSALGHYLTDERLAEAIWNVNSPHNILLQILINGGLGLLVPLAMASLAYGRLMRRGFGREERKVTHRCVVAALTLILISGCVDIALDVPAMQLLFNFLAGLIAGSALMENGAPYPETAARRPSRAAASPV